MSEFERILNEIERDLIASLLSVGYKLRCIQSEIAEIKERVREELASSPFQGKALRAEVKNLFTTMVAGRGYRLPSTWTSNILWVGGQLNADAALCLWLGVFHDQSHKPEGLGQMLADYRRFSGELDFTLPDVITGRFKYPPGGSGERLGDILEDTNTAVCETARDAADVVLKRNGMEPIDESDIRETIAWILADGVVTTTDSDRLEAVRKARGNVDINLRRGYNTLLFKILEDINECIDAA